MKIGIQGIRYDAQSSYLRGAADAPPLIREALHSDSANYWSESGLDLRDVFVDHGDIAPASYEAIQPAVAETPLIYLGGDHSITYPLVRAVAAVHGPVEILHFDAHPDLYDEFEGNRFSHACPFARILESGLATRLVQVGIRTAHGHQREQAKRFGVEMIEMKDFRDDWVPQFRGPLYISFDMDGLDPACAPGVSHWEPGGFTTRQALRVIQSLAGSRIVAADIVEFNPRVEAKMTAMTAAKVLKELAATMLAGSSLQ
jgi:agmatinase